MSECKNIDLFGYLEGIIEEAERNLIETHLRDCRECAGSLNDLKLVIEGGKIIAPLLRRDDCVSADEMRVFFENEIEPKSRKRLESHLLTCAPCRDDLEMLRSIYKPGRVEIDMAGARYGLPEYLRLAYLDRPEDEKRRGKSTVSVLMPSEAFAEKETGEGRELGENDKKEESGRSNGGELADLARLMELEKARLMADLDRRGVEAEHRVAVEEAIVRHGGEMNRLQREFEEKQRALADESARRIEKIRLSESEANPEDSNPEQASVQKNVVCECGASLDPGWEFCPKCGCKRKL